MVLAPVSTTISKARCWLCCPCPSCVHRQSLPIMRAQVRAKQLLNVPVPNGARAMSSRRQRLYCCRVPGQPWAQTAVNLTTEIPISSRIEDVPTLKMPRCGLPYPAESSELLVFYKTQVSLTQRRLSKSVSEALSLVRAFKVVLRCCLAMCHIPSAGHTGCD